MAKKKTVKEKPDEVSEQKTEEKKTPTVFAELPYHVRRMLGSIERHQMRVKDLVEQIEDKYDLSTIIDDVDGWTWGMHVDQQGEVVKSTENGNTLIEYLNRK